MVGNTTFLIGAEDETVAKAKEIIKKHSKKRTTASSTTSSFGTGLREDDFANEVPVGGAIVFTLDVADVDKF
jgi:uncharacterized protein YaaQ